MTNMDTSHQVLTLGERVAEAQFEADYRRMERSHKFINVVFALIYIGTAVLSAVLMKSFGEANNLAAICPLMTAFGVALIVEVLVHVKLKGEW